MDARIEKIKLLSLFTAKDVEHLGVHPATLWRWAKAGIIEKVDRGMYWHPDSKLSEEDLGFAVACKLFGEHSLIGGLSALEYYRLIDFSPRRIWVVVPHHKATTRNRFRLLHSNTDPSIGIDSHPFFRISNMERTLVEALRYSSKIGADVAMTAAMSAIHRNQTNPEKVLRMARKLDLEFAVMRHWEALIGAQEVAQNV